MPDRSVRRAVGFALALIALHTAGFFAPTVFTWGVHFFGFLPAALFGLYLLVAATGVKAAAAGKFEDPLRRLGEALERRPVAVWGVTVLCFVALAFLFRVRVPLLGDSFIAVKLYENRLASPVYAPTAHEFLSFSFFYSLMKLLGLTSYPSMTGAFLIGELFLVAVFLAAAAASVRVAVEGAAQKGAALVLVTGLPYMQLFFGYVENYAFVLAALALYMLAALLYLRGRFPFVLLPVVFGIVFFAHYLNAVLGLSLVYLAYLEFRDRGWRNIARAAGVTAGLGLLVWIAAGSGLRLLVPPERHSSMLSVTRIANVYQAYTLFSPYHGIDLLNLVLLLAPAPLAALLLALTAAGRHVWSSRSARFLIVMLAPVVAVFLLLQFDLPMALDWDIPASYAYVAALLAAAAAVPALGAAGPRVAAVLLVPALLGSVAWWALNATTEPAIARAKLFLDPRISSPDGFYQSTLHLTEWYIHQNDNRNIEEISENFIRSYPDDSRGYVNYTLYLMQFGPSMDAKIREIFDRWLARNPANSDARNQYAHFELDVGQRAYRQGRPAEAVAHLERAAALDSSLGDALNSLALAFKALGNTDSARAWFARAIALDPQNVSAYINLGNMSDDLGRPAEAIGWYEKALAASPDFPAALYNLGITYAKLGDTTRANAALRRAARLGMPDAEQYLRQRQIAW